MTAFTLGAFVGAAIGLVTGFLFWFDYKAERGRFVIPDSLEERSHWVHDGRRYFHDACAPERASPSKPLYVPPSPEPENGRAS